MESQDIIPIAQHYVNGIELAVFLGFSRTSSGKSNKLLANPINSGVCC